MPARPAYSGGLPGRRSPANSKKARKRQNLSLQALDQFPRLEECPRLDIEPLLPAVWLELSALAAFQL